MFRDVVEEYSRTFMIALYTVYVRLRQAPIKSYNAICVISFHSSDAKVYLYTLSEKKKHVYWFLVHEPCHLSILSTTDNVPLEYCYPLKDVQTIPPIQIMYERFLWFQCGLHKLE